MQIPRVHSDKPGENVFVIAEIGKNFIQTEEDRPVEEYIKNAKNLVDAAADIGVDAVKFQTHILKDEQLPIAVTSPHFKGSDRYAWVQRNESATPAAFWKAIKEHCAERGILFFSTPMSRAAARVLHPLDVPFWKVGSGDVLDFVLLSELARTEKPIILSTGMVSFAELEQSVAFLNDRCPLALLYCVSQYPAPPELFNLSTIRDLAQRYPKAVIGFSDHSLGIEAALAAVKIGARIVEKHFSLSRDLWGSDHKVSMTPHELESLVQAIRSREFEQADPKPYLGEPHRELDGATNPYREYFHKKLVYAHDVSADTQITEEDLFAMRPALLNEGMASNRLLEVLGKTIARDQKTYDPILEDSLL